MSQQIQKVTANDKGRFSVVDFEVCAEMTVIQKKMGEGFENVLIFHAKLNLLPLCAVSQFKSFYTKLIISLLRCM